MKKLILIMLVAMVPFITMAQKNSKKDKDSSNKYEFMIIKGVEVNHNQIDYRGGDSPTDGLSSSGDIQSQEQVYSLLKGNSELMVWFDAGDNRSDEIVKLNKNSHAMHTMASAVNMAASYGWEFVNGTVLDKDMALIHYYYMQRTK